MYVVLSMLIKVDWTFIFIFKIPNVSMIIKVVYLIEKIKKRLFISISIPIKNRNISQDCLFHLAYKLKIETYAKIVYFN